MALTSTFYDGVVTETDRAANRAGSPSYGVYGSDDFKVKAHPTIPFAVLVTKGRAHGRGVTDTAVEDETVQCASNSTGTRWDLVVVRRNWQPAFGGPSTLEVIQGGSTPAIPAARKNNPGVEDDQPIALVQWVGNASAPQSFIDLRCWAAGGGLEAAHDLAKGYLAEPGTALKIGALVWRYAMQANGVWSWEPGTPRVHLELTTQQGKNLANQGFGPGTTDKLKAGINTARSFNQDQFTIGPADRISVNREGLYAISWMIFGMGNASGAIQLRAGNTPIAHASLGFTAVNDVTITVPNIYLFAGDQVGFYFFTQQSVPSGHHVRFTKIG